MNEAVSTAMGATRVKGNIKTVLAVEKDTDDIGIRSACLKYPAGCIDGTGSHAVPNDAVKMTAKDDHPNDHDFYHRPQTTSSITVLLKQTSPQSRLN